MRLALMFASVLAWVVILVGASSVVGHALNFYLVYSGQVLIGEPVSINDLGDSPQDSLIGCLLSFGVIVLGAAVRTVAARKMKRAS
jgi:hypothetical protein